MNELLRSIFNRQEYFCLPNTISSEIEPLCYLVLCNMEPVTTVLIVLNADNACFSVLKSIKWTDIREVLCFVFKVFADKYYLCTRGFSSDCVLTRAPVLLPLRPRAPTNSIREFFHSWDRYLLIASYKIHQYLNTSLHSRIHKLYNDLSETKSVYFYFYNLKEK